jgi:Protein of unknown function (DUF3592)
VVYTLLTLLIGAATLWAAWFVAREVRRTSRWPTTPGRILARGLGEPMGGPGRSYLPAVRYTYAVDGRTYTNDQVYVLRRTGGLADRMRRLVDGLPDPVPVHYDPADPSRSFLLAQPRSSFWVPAVLGTAITLVGFLKVLVWAVSLSR